MNRNRTARRDSRHATLEKRRLASWSRRGSASRGAAGAGQADSKKTSAVRVDFSTDTADFQATMWRGEQ